MAAVPVPLTATYDDATSTLTIIATLPPPAPPAGYSENESWWTLGSPSISVDVKVTKKTPITGGFAFYLTTDATGRTHKWRVDYNANTGTWNMPGVEVPYP
jgi:hypothetical protein